MGAAETQWWRDAATFLNEHDEAPAHSVHDDTVEGDWGVPGSFISGTYDRQAQGQAEVNDQLLPFSHNDQDLQSQPEDFSVVQDFADYLPASSQVGYNAALARGYDGYDGHMIADSSAKFHPRSLKIESPAEEGDEGVQSLVEAVSEYAPSRNSPKQAHRYAGASTSMPFEEPQLFDHESGFGHPQYPQHTFPLVKLEAEEIADQGMSPMHPAANHKLIHPNRGPHRGMLPGGVPPAVATMALPPHHGDMAPGHPGHLDLAPHSKALLARLSHDPASSEPAPDSPTPTRPGFAGHAAKRAGSSLLRAASVAASEVGTPGASSSSSAGSGSGSGRKRSAEDACLTQTISSFEPSAKSVALDHSRSRASHNWGTWTPEEDQALTLAVQRLGNKNWKQIAVHVSTRTSWQCSQRWLKVLKPGLVKGPWSTEEDDILMDKLKAVKPGESVSWTAIAKAIPGRTAKQCRERYTLSLDPQISRGPWTEAEDECIIRMYAEHGSRWAKMRQEIPTRTENQIKSRFKTLKHAFEKDKTTHWTPELVQRLNDLVDRFDGDLSRIRRHLPHELKGSSAAALKARCPRIRRC